MSFIPENIFRRRLGLALVALLVLTLGACDLGLESASNDDGDDTQTAAQQAADELAAAQLAAEQAAAEVAEREAALAEAEAAAQAQQAQIEATERELAQRQAALAEEQRRARAEEERRAQEERLAAERAEAEQRAAELAERERQVAEREAELRQQEADRQAALDRQREAEAAAREAERASTPDYVEATLRPGTILEIEINETLTSQNSLIGDTFSSTLAKDIYTDEGVLAVPAGSEVRGKVIEVTPLKRVGGQASIGIAFTELIPPVGPPIGLKASFVEVGADRKGEKKKIIAGAIAGAILGRVIGGKGAGEVLAGAAVGAAAGTAVVGAKADGKEAVIPAGEVVGLVLEEVVTVTTEVTGVVGER